MKPLLKDVRGCTLCDEHLPLGPNPVLRASDTAKIAIIGQAPGTKVHASGIPWNDPSGNELRRWLAISPDVFYDESMVAIIPMGFCYPGRGKSGDLPPRPECAPLWHKQLFEEMPNIKLKLLIGQYALRYYLGADIKQNLTETVKAFAEYLPASIPLVHPSPRNRFWMKRNPWFEKEVIPILRREFQHALEE